MTEMQEVEVPEAEDTVDETTETPAAESTETKPAKEEKKGKRAKLPDGYGTPIQFNNKLNEWLKAQAEAAGEDVSEWDDHRPQVIYSYIKNRSKEDPFPVVFVTEAGEERAEDDDETRPALRLAGDETHDQFAEAFAWWLRKEERVKTRQANAAKKAADKKAKASAKTEDAEPAEPAPNELAEVEEAE
jgi:hypothetical protein